MQSNPKMHSISFNQMDKGFLSIPPGNIMGIERDNWPEVG